MPLKVQGQVAAVLTKPAGAQGVQMRNAVLGSWARTGLAGALLVLLVGGIGVLAVTGRLGDLRYLNIPLVHPWPPVGYYQNPFNPTDRGDLVNASDAATVKADLLADGKIELDALEQGNQALAAQADTGSALVKLQQLIADNNAAGIFERQQTHLDSLVVGKLADPNNAAVTWCVEEKGTGTITKFRKSTGELLSSVTVRVTAKFWLVSSGGHYLITDTQIVAQPLTGG